MPKEEKIPDYLNAKPCQDVDKAKVKWPKRKKILPRGKTQFKQKAHFHPGTKEARQVLEQVGRNLKVCQRCNSTYRVAVHHRDKNPFNNSLDNLDILCDDCHKTEHSLSEGIKHE